MLIILPIEWPLWRFVQIQKLLLLSSFICLLFLSVSTLAQEQTPVCSSMECCYEEKLPENEQLISCDFFGTVSQNEDSLYVLRRYYPDTKQLIRLYYGTKSNVNAAKEGAYKSWYDDGAPMTTGAYANNEKTGHWIYYRMRGSEQKKSEGEYLSGEQEGEWVYYLPQSYVKKITYANGKRNGQYLLLDSLGNTVKSGTYKNDEWVSGDKENDISGTSIEVTKMPAFPGCKKKYKVAEDRMKCANKKLAQYIVETIEYPEAMRQQSIEGTVYVVFEVDKEGNIVDVISKRGVCDAFKNESLRIINAMPNWNPGEKTDGEEISVDFTLPIRFKLE